jgi:hypothetical protein
MVVENFLDLSSLDTVHDGLIFPFDSYIEGEYCPGPGT